MADEMDKRERVILDRYVLEAALNDIARHPGWFAERLHYQQAAEYLVSEHIRDAGLTSHKLRSYYHSDNVNESVQHMTALALRQLPALKFPSPTTGLLISDVLAFVLLRVLVLNHEAEAQLPADGPGIVGGERDVIRVKS